MATIPVGLQLYSVRKDCEADLPGTLKAVAEMGYTGVEFAGYYGRTAQELRTLLDDNGLNVAGTHTPFKSVQDDELQQTIEFNQAIGNKYLIVPSIPQDRRGTREAWQETARFFNELTEKVKPHGMHVGYHNHSFEFQPLDGELPWDTLGQNTKPEVILQLDLGNAMHGGVDPVPFLRKYADRAITVHLKDRSTTNDKALLGEGEIDFREVFRICESTGKTQWYIVEQESYAYPPLECVRRCRENLRNMGR
ncbi:MAG TPA: sugar phosphate isomerase/epimerase [Chloroflexota bacterium]|nr:sugar phosphate isomerase/epimerase [Chloroflexota bacterium]